MKPLARILPFIAVPLLILSALIQVKLSLLGDKGWLMLAADHWLSGKKLYVDIFEVNPPLIIWLYSLPVWLAKHFSGIKDYIALGVMGIAVTIITTLLCLRLLADHPVFKETPRRPVEFALLLSGIFMFIISPVYFFDREHITLMLTFPYMLRFMPTLAHRHYSLRLRIAIGCFAAIGFLIKPHAVLVFVALQLFTLARERSPFILISVENGIIYLSGISYFACIAYFTPQYLTTVLPMAASVYSSYNITHGAMHYFVPLALLCTVIPLLDFRIHYRSPYRREIYYFMLVTLAYFAYALINNGWGYTWQPFFCMVTFLTVWIFWEYNWLNREQRQKGLRPKPFDIGLRGCLYCLTLTGLYGLFSLQMLLLAPGCGGYSDCDAHTVFVDVIHKKHIRSFGVMSGEFTRWPLISRQSGAQWDTRFNHLWMVPGLIHAQEEKATSDKWASDQWIVNYVGRAFADDLTKRTPDAMFIDNSDEFFTYPPRNVNLIALFEAVPEFKAAWRQYRYDSTINRCPFQTRQTAGCKYDVWLRKG